MPGNINTDPVAAPAWQRLIARADLAMEWVSRRRDRIRTIGLIAALLIFGGGIYLALASSPGLLAEVWLAPLIVLTVISAPIGTALNAAELWALSRISRGPMTWRSSFEFTVYTSAANMLPLPGGAMTKLAGFKAHGIGYKTGIGMIVLSFLIWGGLAFLYSAAALFLMNETSLAGLFLLAAVTLGGTSTWGFARFRRWDMVAIVVLTRLLNFAVEGVRYWLALTAMGIAVSYLQCSVFAVVTFIGAAVIFVPSGLGVSEAAGAVVATFVGISAASGFISTAIQRVVRLVGLAGLAVGFMLLGKRPAAAEVIPDRAGIS